MSEELSVLVVEDVSALRAALTRKLASAGFKALEAKDGEEGLEHALTHKPHLILLDILMPQMDGLTMLKHLRADQWGASVPVIMLTNLIDQHYIDEAEEHGVEAYLVKSDWKLEDIVVRVKEALPAT